jgi:hypothetical protein
MSTTTFHSAIALVLALILQFTNTTAAADAGLEIELRNESTQWMRAVSLKSGKALPYYGSRSLAEPDAAVKAVLVVIPGGETNGPVYFQAAMETTRVAGRLDDTAVITLQFQTADQNPRRDELYWTGAWQEGADSLEGSKTSSFAVLDEVLELASRSFPDAKSIVLAGHSSGGQIINRYVALGGPIADSDRLVFVVMNPSTYVYMDDRRVRDDGTFRRPVGTTTDCPGFNDWKYGIDTLPPYAAQLSLEEVHQRMFRRNVVLMPGLDDKGPEGVDTNCPAMYHGVNRIERTRHYWNYIQTFPSWKQNVRLIEVPGIGHAGGEMIKSSQFRELVFQNLN